MYRRAMFQRVRAGQQIEYGIHLTCRPEQSGWREHHASPCLRGIDARKVHGGALSGFGAFDPRSVDLQAANADALPGGVQFEVVVNAKAPRDERPGDHGAVPAHRKAAVDRKARIAFHFPAGEGGRGPFESRAQFRESRAGHGAHGNDGRAFEKGASGKLLDFETRQVDHVGIGEIAFVERDQPVTDPQQTANIEMLAGLRHDRFTRGDYQQHQIDAGGSGKHILDEPLMAGHIDKSRGADARN